MRLWVSENPCKRERERQREAHKRGIERGVSCKGWVYSSSFLVFLSCPSLSSFIPHPSFLILHFPSFLSHSLFPSSLFIPSGEAQAERPPHHRTCAQRNDQAVVGPSQHRRERHRGRWRLGGQSWSWCFRYYFLCPLAWNCHSVDDKPIWIYKPNSHFDGREIRLP